jgi:hypothetical protein
VAVNLAKPVIVFAGAGILVHIMVMLLDSYLLIKPLYLDLRQNFVGSIFSTPMIPMMGAYGFFSVIVLFLWGKKKQALLVAREKDMQKDKVEAVLKSMQRITAIMVQNLATHNAEIMHWIELRKRHGRPVSPEMESSSKKIAEALQSLSEVSFVFPYTENRPNHVGDIEHVLLGKLQDVAQIQEGSERASVEHVFGARYPHALHHGLSGTRPGRWRGLS